MGITEGDSLGLSRKAAADNDARFIVFCGVHFMAESAEILSQPYQTVQIPDLKAGCPMADMADINNVNRAWEEVTSITGEGSVMPIVYMNSDADIKAFCGRHGGLFAPHRMRRSPLTGDLASVRRFSFFRTNILDAIPEIR